MSVFTLIQHYLSGHAERMPRECYNLSRFTLECLIVRPLFTKKVKIGPFNLVKLINVEQEQFNPSDVSILYLFTNQYQAVQSFKNFPSQPDIILFIFDKISLKQFSLTFKKS
jgi:hypothetical protein